MLGRSCRPKGRRAGRAARCGRRTEQPPWGLGARNASRFPAAFEPGAYEPETGPAPWFPRARRRVQGPVLLPSDGRRPAARVRRPRVERCARLLDPGEAPRGVRERRPPPAARRRGVAGALPGRDVAVPAGHARIPVHDRRHMAVRILVCTGLPYQDLIRRGAFGDDGRLPPVLPVVPYDGRPRRTAPVEVGERAAPDCDPTRTPTRRPNGARTPPPPATSFPPGGRPGPDPEPPPTTPPTPRRAAHPTSAPSVPTMSVSGADAAECSRKAEGAT